MTLQLKHSKRVISKNETTTIKRNTIQRYYIWQTFSEFVRSQSHLTLQYDFSWEIYSKIIIKILTHDQSLKNQVNSLETQGPKMLNDALWDICNELSTQ